VRLLVHSRAILETEPAPFHRSRNSISKQKPSRINWRPYLRLTPQDLWNTDLDGFLEEWEALLREDEQMEATNKPRKKGTVIRTRRSIGGPLRKRTMTTMTTTLKPTTNQRRVQVPNERLEKRQRLELLRVKPRLLLLLLPLRQAATMRMNLQLAIESV
jgi:hypothetical protein